MDQNVPVLVLGTAQLGMHYGIANRRGVLSKEEAEKVISAAQAEGITDFDTAHAYGESEARLGDALASHKDVRIITKLSPLDHLNDGAPVEDVVNAAKASVAKSLKSLKRGRLQVLLLHRARHLHAMGGAVWDCLLKLRDEQRIGTLGISVQDPAELRVALSFRDVKHIQVPLNLLDWRFRDPALVTRLSLRPDVTIHARSALLQGLLGMKDLARWPRIGGFDAPGLIATLNELVAQFERRSIPDLCFAYVRAQRFVHGVVVGAESVEQVRANAALFKAAPLTPEQVAHVDQVVPKLPEAVLNPALWPQAA